MAEIRKHKPSAGSPVAQALEKALGASVRPVTPGAPPQPNAPKQAPTTKPPTITSATAAAGGWVSIKPGQAPKVAKQPDEDES
ncbi:MULTISPECIES: hypothetical protein [unclassified Luteococcus]|uniref:hypothetical protein n=1 Tax=unclassified Luteococcus TaxID=2639923 RepID=UPI00313B712F